LRKFYLQYKQLGSPSFTDDAYYYFLVARHLVHGGGSSFDGFTLSNGYHPLWLGMLVVQYKLFGESLVLTRLLEYLLGLGGLIAALRLARLHGAFVNSVFALGYFYALSLLALNGMETALFAFTAGSLALYLDKRFGQQSGSGVIAGMLAVATIASRIDCAVFVFPMLLLAAAPARRKVSALAVTFLSGFLYAVWNLHVFGIAFPVSGAVKSLGGLQINHPLLHQLAKPGYPASLLLYCSVVLLVVSASVREIRARLPRRFVLAVALGFALFASRLCFFSSWPLWSWYAYPFLLVYLACFPAVLGALQERTGKLLRPRQRAALAAAAALLVVAFSLPAVLHPPAIGATDMYALNQRAVKQFAPLLAGARVAMGDRAGNFAYLYSGGVNQLEGLMNDKQYLEVLRAHGDVRAFLCQEDVRYLLSYEKDLGNYQSFQVQTIRRQLSQYPAPQITVSRQDELGRAGDLSLFDARKIGDDTSYLYLWRLRCP